jgi:hypothetical protein
MANLLGTIDKAPMEVWVTPFSDAALSLLKGWKRAAGDNRKRVVIAADSLSLWTESRPQPISLWDEPDWLPGDGNSPVEIHRRISRAVEETILNKWPLVSPFLANIIVPDITYLLAPILLVSSAIEQLLDRDSCGVFLDPSLAGTEIMAERLRASGTVVRFWGGTRRWLRDRSPLRLWGRTWECCARYGLPRRLAPRSLVFMLSAPYYIRKLDPTFLPALRGEGISTYRAAFGGPQDRKIAHLIALLNVNVVEPLEGTRRFLVGFPSSTKGGTELLERAIESYGPRYLQIASMLFGGIRAALERMRPSAVIAHFQGYAEGAALFSAAQDLGIKTVLIQAGAFTHVDQYVRPLADYYLARDRAEGQRLLESGVSTEAVRSFGSVFRSKKHKQHSPKANLGSREVIGICSGGLYGPSGPNHWNKAVEIARQFGPHRSSRFLVRPHPSESRVAVQAMAEAFLGGCQWEMDTSPDIASFLEKVAVVIHDASTVGSDAKELGVLALSTSNDGAGGPDIPLSDLDSDEAVVQKTVQFICSLV